MRKNKAAPMQTGQETCCVFVTMFQVGRRDTVRDAFLKQLCMFWASQLHWSVCYVNTMADLKSQLQSLWLVVAALASMFTVVFIPRIQSCAALSPGCDYAVSQFWHQCCHFHSGTLRGLIEVLQQRHTLFYCESNNSSAFWWLVQESANYG